MPTWPDSPAPRSVDDLTPGVEILTLNVDQTVYSVRRRTGSSVVSRFALVYLHLNTHERNTLRYFIANDLAHGQNAFDWTMPSINGLALTDLTSGVITTAVAHPYTVNQWVAVSGTPSSDGNYRISATSDSTHLTLVGISGSASIGTIRPHLPNALLTMDQGQVPQAVKIDGPMTDTTGLWNWTINIQGVGV